MPPIVRVDHRQPKFPPLGATDTAGASRITEVDQKSLRVMRTASDKKIRALSPPWHTLNGWRVYYVISELEAWVKARADKLRSEADAREAQARAAIEAVTAESSP